MSSAIATLSEFQGLQGLLRREDNLKFSCVRELGFQRLQRLLSIQMRMRELVAVAAQQP